MDEGFPLDVSGGGKSLARHLCLMMVKNQEQRQDRAHKAEAKEGTIESSLSRVGI